MKKKKLHFIPLGGLGEVGRNMMLFGYDDKYIIIDCGVQFPDSSMIGIDFIIPDMTFLQGKEANILGVFVTHAHEDHIGGLVHLFKVIENVPTYATQLTAGMIEARLARGGQLNKTKIHVTNAGETVETGPFKVEFIHVTHSIPDSVAFAIHTPVGTVVVTGDFKFDMTPIDGWGTDIPKLASVGDKGVLALFSDSTNSEKSGWTPTERDITPTFERVFEEAPGRIIISSFSSLISRLQQVTDIARRYGRKICVVGTSMIDNVNLAKKLGYLEMPDDVLVTLETALTLPDDKVVILCTGSQGETTAILGRLSTGKYHAFSIKEGDTIVFSSHPIPGNEEQVSKVINRFLRMGAKVIYDSLWSVHVSGHACAEEMKMMINLIRPKYLIPIHGELRQLTRHKVLGRMMDIPDENIFVIENGQTIVFEAGEAKLGPKVPASIVLVDGTNVGDMNADILYQRERLADSGVVVVTLILNRGNNSLVREPKIIHEGLMTEKEMMSYQAELDELIASTIARKNGQKNVQSQEALEKNLEQALRKFFYTVTGRTPWIIVNPFYL